MPHRCVAGWCSNTAKDGVSVHGWPSNTQLARQWTNAVRNTQANFNLTTSSKLCSSHFSDNSFETQSVITHSLGLSMKKILKPGTVLTIFNNCLPQKKQSWDDSTDCTEGSRRAGLSKFRGSTGEPIEKEKQPGYVLQII